MTYTDAADPQLLACTWAMKSLFASGWIAIDAEQAVDAMECGVEVRLVSFAWLLGLEASGVAA